LAFPLEVLDHGDLGLVLKVSGSVLLHQLGNNFEFFQVVLSKLIGLFSHFISILVHILDLLLLLYKVIEVPFVVYKLLQLISLEALQLVHDGVDVGNSDHFFHFSIDIRSPNQPLQLLSRCLLRPLLFSSDLSFFCLFSQLLLIGLDDLLWYGWVHVKLVVDEPEDMQEV
jgi:hypothetical protein